MFLGLSDLDWITRIFLFFFYLKREREKGVGLGSFPPNLGLYLGSWKKQTGGGEGEIS